MNQLTKIKWIRISEELDKKLSKLKKYSIVESKFIRLAIEEKLERDMKVIIDKFEKEKQKECCPF